MIPGILAASIAGGDTTSQFDPAALTNRFDKPFAISSIRFSTNAANAGVPWLDFTAVRLWAGATELTRGYTPITCVCPVQDRLSIGSGSVNNSPGSELIAWELAKPLVLPANTAIGAALSTQDWASDGFVADDAGPPVLPKIQITLVGMVLDTPYNPYELAAIPYAVAWRSKVFTTGNLISSPLVPLNDQSPSSLFANPFDVPFFVKSLVCANLTNYSGSGDFGDRNNGDGLVTNQGVFGQNAQAAGWYRAPQYQIVRSGSPTETAKGTNYINKDYATAKSLFYLPTREWRMNAALAPKEYFQIRAQGWLGPDQRNPLPGTRGPSNQYQHRIGMTGYRLVPGNTIWH